MESIYSYKRVMKSIHTCTCIAQKPKEDSDRSLMQTDHEGHHSCNFTARGPMNMDYAQMLFGLFIAASSLRHLYQIRRRSHWPKVLHRSKEMMNGI